MNAKPRPPLTDNERLHAVRAIDSAAEVLQLAAMLMEMGDDEEATGYLLAVQQELENINKGGDWAGFVASLMAQVTELQEEQECADLHPQMRVLH